ncbi:MAG: DUF1501 domain-containing protein [Verrucomicrobiales bacterium]|nr:DUF1501 domain-containing protein [Verrucomicrobiales bacterium]
MNLLHDYECGTSDHFSRRTLLKTAGLSSLSWLTPMADVLATNAEKTPDLAKSIIILWLNGGPSQIDTFDPHPGKKIAADSKAIETSKKGVFVNEHLPQTAEMMGDISLVRSVVSREGDHERAIYNIKTGYRPVPGVVHPAIGSIVCHEMPRPNIDIPTHISILPGQFPSRGGFLGAQYDAFKMGDPTQPVPDLKARVGEDRQKARLESLEVVEKRFHRGRSETLAKTRTLHSDMMKQARKMMTSEQLDAFNVNDVPKSEREPFGDTPFGRGCLAAIRLVEAGVRCVEVTLSGWDTHVDNTNLTSERTKILDPAFASLIKSLKDRGLYDNTVVLCGGEFGRTPHLNPADGRDHWPHGFSMAIGGGGIAGGRVIGETDPNGEKKDPAGRINVQDVHATIQYAFGIESDRQIITPAKRPIKLSDGFVIDELL